MRWCAPAAPQPLSIPPSRLQGYVSSANYSGKRTTLVLFINGRPVECGPLRRALEGVYAAVLPKGYKPFMFLVRRGAGRRAGVRAGGCRLHPT